MNNFKIDKIYIITINNNDNKNNDIIHRLNQLGIVDVSFEIINGHNGHVDNLPDNCKVYDGWKLNDTDNLWWNRDVKPGEIGCMISHAKAWEKIKLDGTKRALILEEDFLGVVNLSELQECELSDDYWDLAYLGRYTFNEAENVRIDDNWVKSGMSYNTHAYVLTYEGANRLLAHNPLHNIIPSDEFFSAVMSNHRRHDINVIYPNKNIRAISTNISWIAQTSNNETSSTENEPIISHVEKPPYFEILDDSNWAEWKSKYVNQTISNGEYDLMVDDLGDNIYEFQLFTEKFCKEAIALAETKNKWTVGRHKFYPTNDVLLQEIGLSVIYSRVLKEVVYPICIHLWKLEGSGWDTMFSENFIARYATDRQSHLSLHHDFSHITTVVKLNDEFEGGGTWFPKYKVLSNPERVGVATLHPGLITHQHGARPIYSGTRYVCVSFMRKE